MSDTAMDSSCSPLYPIREVSRITGINSVTLRAWERRYGLIRPQRTPKGHRLYGQEDIERIRRILQWLDRGVPVSQVHDLLARPERAASPVPESGEWEQQRQQVIQALESLDQSRLETFYTQSLALYPVATCLEELWLPVVAWIEARDTERFGATLQRQLFESFLRTRIGTRLYHANQMAHGPTLLISPLSEEGGMLWPLLLGLAGADAGFRVLLWDAPPAYNELPLAISRLRLDALLWASGLAESTDMTRHRLPRLAGQLKIPVCMAGPVANIRADELAETAVETLGSEPLQAFDRLHSLLRK